MLFHFPTLSKGIFLLFFVGLMNCVNHPNIKTPVDLAYVLYELERKNNTLMEEKIKTEKINFELSVECQSVNERYQKNNRNYQKFLEDKEKQLEGFLEKKREATLKNQKLIRDIGMLNDRLTLLKKENKILNEENKLFCAKIDDEFYQKQTELKNERIQNLQSKIEELMTESKKLSNENYPTENYQYYSFQHVFLCGDNKIEN